jgi:hypothetical protein
MATKFIKPKAIEKKAEELIEKGGSIAKADNTLTNEEKDFATITLRIPKKDLEQIDEIIKNKKPKPKRHTWILEAIYSRYKKEVENQK